jgi:hypothetical protein
MTREQISSCESSRPCVEPESYLLFSQESATELYMKAGASRRFHFQFPLLGHSRKSAETKTCGTLVKLIFNVRSCWRHSQPQDGLWN